MGKFIEIKQKGNITEVVLNRPETYNAFNLEMMTELAKHLNQLAMDNSVRGVSITGTRFDEPISSARALEWGLATKIVEDGTVLEEANGMLDKLIEKSNHSFGWSKRLITDSFNNSLESRLEFEKEGLSDCASHVDGQEGLKAFMENANPYFGDK
jgi:enoyl-CoA hydratase/carnithine racemase